MRKRIRGRVLAGILAAVMLCTAVPETAYAVEGTEGTEQPVQEQVETGGGQPETVREDDKNPGEGEIPEDDKTPGNEETPEGDKDPKDGGNSEGDKTPGDGEDLGDEGTPGDGDAVEEDPIPEDENVSEGDEVPGEQETEQPEDVEAEETAEVVEELPEVSEKENTFVETTIEESGEPALYAANASNGGYPYSVAAGVYQRDKWDFFQCECTSFVAYCLNEKNGVPFSNTMYGTGNDERWGDANHWKQVAQRNGFIVDSNPAVGAVAWTNRGGCGHVAWVSAVNGNNVTIEQYNGNIVYINGVQHGDHKYSKIPVDKSRYEYIHIKDLPAVPQDHGMYHEIGLYPLIPDGVYHIVSALGDRWWMTIGGLSTDDGGNVQLWGYDDMECDHHLYRFKFIDDGKGTGRGFYTIQNVKSGLYLESDGANEWLYYQDRSDKKRTNVQQGKRKQGYKGSGQEWAVNEIDRGDKGLFYTFMARCSGYYMDVEDGTAADGTNISMWHEENTANNKAVQWRLIPWAPSIGQTIRDGEYQIAPLPAGDKVVSIAGSNPQDGANVELNSYKGDYRHTFDVKYEGNGYYSIINKYSGLSMDVAGGSGTRKLGANIQLGKRDINSGAQKWMIKPCENNNGYYQVISACNGLYLDLQAGGTKDGNNIGLWRGAYANASVNLQWKFIPYVKPKLTPPTASIPTNTEVEKGTAVSLSCGVSGAAIYYTLDGTAPGETSSRYTGPIVIEKDTVIKAVAVKSGCQNSDTAVFTYTVKTAEMPDKPENPDIPETPDKPENPDIPETPDKPGVPDEPETPDISGRGEVLEEDVPQGKVENIPQGLWMSEIAPQTYTGRAIKPEVRVYDYKTRLVEKRDYTISYKNNVKANASSGKKAPTITVAGKGNYTGKETQTFEIRPKLLTDEDITADSLTVSYTGKAQKPVPAVIWNGKRLARNRDYQVTYPHAQQTGVYTILIEGVGNYGGERQVSLTITQGIPVSKLRVDKIVNQVYTGSALTPTPVVKNGRKVLTQGEDYVLSYQNNTEVGTASVIVTGMGEYAGERRVSFRILSEAVLRSGTAELRFDHLPVYTGGEVKPDSYELKIPVKNAEGKRVMKTLKEGEDYRVVYQNHIRPGTASICFQGINGYTGTLKKTYQISPFSIEEGAGDEGQIRIEMADSYAYTKGGCKPEPMVTFQGMTLKRGTDYTLSYKNNAALNDGSNPEKLPSVTIKGRGCFTGAREVAYKITAKDIGGLTMSASDKVWQNKKNSYRTKVVIRDIDGKALSAGKDYEKLLGYTYDTDITLSDGTVRKAGEDVVESDILPAGTVIRVTASAKGSNYTGTLTGSYRITKSDIGKAKVTIPAQTYTGREVRPDREIQVKLDGQVLSGDNYEITGYTNNINKGTATVTIKGRNDCGGVKSAKFRIKGKGVLWWWRQGV